jgi:Trp operon repressor
MRFLLEADNAGEIKSSYTDKELEDMPISRLSNLIDDYKIGTNINERTRIIKHFLDKKLGANSDKFSDQLVLRSIAENIYDVGIDNNPFLSFIEKYADSDTPKLSFDVSVFVNNLLANRVFKSSSDVLAADYLYNDKTYDETNANDIIYKLKTFLFVKNKSNLKKFDIPNNIYSIIKDKSAEEIKNILSGYQEQNRNELDGIDIIAEHYNISNNDVTDQYVKSYIIEICKESNELKSKSEDIKDFLENSLSGKYSTVRDGLNNILNTTYSDTKRNSAEDVFNIRLIDFIAKQLKSNTSSSKTGFQIVKDAIRKATNQLPKKLTKKQVEQYITELAKKTNRNYTTVKLALENQDELPQKVLNLLKMTYTAPDIDGMTAASVFNNLLLKFIDNDDMFKTK